ncbi:efflux RND transporter periplasmic adaptor subunit [Aliikangiella sp. G2MR2-5]|uniref:efflux RND transporter periplasmic adaptor subunit n=1 Tax=Aliikangiella sp. G2MR2-5 TaxID=2788943 RepID=UPI0018A9DB84|nr:efflux RND transporter periplasmic adaptor subunit [Aliikangiella sp. G2MR2-5]
MKINFHSLSSFFVVFLLLSQQVKAQQMPPASVNVEKAQMKLLAPVAWVSGSVVSRNNSQIAAEVNGRLVDLAELGELVEQGQVIAKIDDTRLKIQRREASANVENAISRLSYLESEVNRKSALAKRNLSAKTDLDETVSDRDVAKGDLAAARARLAQVEQQLADSQVKAPFSGIVAQRLSSQGEMVNSGTPIIRLVETANLEASVYAPLTAYQFLTRSQTLNVESALGKATVPIKTLVPIADSRSHLMEVRLDMSSINWPVGLSIKAGVASGEQREVLAVPRDALVLRREGTSIFKVNEQSLAEQIQVELGIGAGAWIQVIGKVEAGDKIIIRGAERLRSGQPVLIKPDNRNLISGAATD